MQWQVMETLRRLLNVSGPALIGAVVLAVMLPGTAAAKGFTRAILVGSDGRWVEIHARDLSIDGLLSARGFVEPIRGGYVRLFFVGPGDFPREPGALLPRAGMCRARLAHVRAIVSPDQLSARSHFAAGSFACPLRCTPDQPREHHVPRPTVRHDHNGGRAQDRGRACT